MPNRFELLEQLGRGGMGVVWKARDRESGQLVALKLLHSIFADDPDYLERFEREVEVTRRIESPHVVRVLGYGAMDGVPYMAMEYVEGESLREAIRRRGPLPWEDVRSILIQAARGLAAAHASGVVHRDVKPSNILVRADGQAKLSDFGIARAMDLTLTGSSTMLGTPAYMAPEGVASERSDLYALGIVAYEALTGAPPFTGESMQEVLIKHIREAPDLERLPPLAREIIGALLEKEPTKRLQGTAELVSLLVPHSTRQLERSNGNAFSSVTIEFERQLSGGNGWVYSVSFAPSGDWLASGHKDGVVRIWNSKSGEVADAIKLRGAVFEVAWAPVGLTLACASASGDVIEIELPERKMEVVAHVNGAAYSVAYSSRGDILVSSGRDGELRVCRERVNERGARTRQVSCLAGGQKGPIIAARFSVKDVLACVGRDGPIGLWSVELAKQVASLRGRRSLVSAVAFTPSGRELAGAVGRSVVIWDVETKKLVTKLRGRNGPLYTLAFSPSGRLLASAGAAGRVHFWDWRRELCIDSVRVHDGRINSVAFSPDGARLATASDDGTVKMWRIADS